MLWLMWKELKKISVFTILHMWSGSILVGLCILFYLYFIHTQSSALSFNKNFFIKNCWKGYLFRRWKQTECPLFEKLCSKKHSHTLILSEDSRYLTIKLTRIDKEQWALHNCYESCSKICQKVNSKLEH